MGGSLSYTTGGGGSGYNQSCASILQFTVIIIANEEDVWSNCNVNDSIEIVFVNDGGLPKLTVERADNGFEIGIVPASYTHLIDCIDEGWVYRGKIKEKNGNMNDPELIVELKGEKSE